jgi:chemotaxis protein MotA
MALSMTDIGPDGRVEPQFVDAGNPPRRLAVPAALIAPLESGGRDLATVAGLAAGLALLVAAILLGGALPPYADLPAFMMVLGGTAAVTLVSFSVEDVQRLPEVIRTTLLRKIPRAPDVAMRLVALADLARQQGFLAVESQLAKLGDDRFLVKAMALVIDNTAPDVIARELRVELQAILARHQRAAALLRRAGEVAPAMGLVGTLVGLVRMLSSLDNPASIGPAMAVAILATLYGAVLANMVLLPLAHKLERNSGSEALLHHLTSLAAISIAEQENPRRTEVVLNSVLPPADRIAYFD